MRLRILELPVGHDPLTNDYRVPFVLVLDDLDLAPQTDAAQQCTRNPSLGRDRPVKIRMPLAVLAGSAALLVPLAASCSGYPTGDRQGPNGAQPDGYQDQTHVVIYRAPDQVPNVAVFCVGQHGFISSLKNSGSSSGGAAPSMLRFPEYDETCKR